MTILGEFGRLVDVTFDDNRWTSGLLENGGACGSSGAPDDGLHATDFVFIETTADSGMFTADFAIPFTYCDSDVGLIQTTAGTDIEINYVDFTNVTNSIIEVSDSAGISALFCNDMTVDELISSGLYNLIDNRDGHLDGVRIDGTNGDDLILASDIGNEIRSKQGNDCVIGGSGNDEIRGGSNNDQLFGNGGNDLILGGNHDDVLYGGEGDDQLRGGKGTDTATAYCETIKKVP